MRVKVLGAIAIPKACPSLAEPDAIGFPSAMFHMKHYKNCS